MMKQVWQLLLLIAVFLCGVIVGLPAHAQSIAQRIDHMVKECEAVMVPGSEVCRVFLDKRDYGTQTTIPTAYGRISVDAYLKVRNAGERMCVLAREVCTANWDGDECKAVRLLWRQTPR